MIRLFERNEVSFNHNKNILSPISCYVLEEANGMFEVECEVDKTVAIGNGDIIKTPTPRGEQLFRVYRVIKSLKGKKAYAKHIFYDLTKNFIIDASSNNITCQTALQSALTNTEYEHGFTGSSDIGDLESYSFVRTNPISAIMGDGGVLDKWGGYLIRNNYSIQIKAAGIDRGYEIRMGKNLIGIEDDSDESSVKTRIYPTVVLGDKDTVYALPEKYVDSPLINNYGDPIIYEERLSLTDEQKELPLSEIYTIMRNHCNELYSLYNIDKPVINYKVDFIELSKTEQYKDMAILEQIDLHDIVSCYIIQLNISVKAKVIKYKYDCLKKRYDSIELGGFKAVSNYQVDNIVKRIQERLKVNETAIDHATNVITGNKGGYLITRRYPNGKPYEILIMDTEDINTAVNVLRINNSGVGFSKAGYNGPYGTAMTLDGHIVADFMDTGTLTAILLKSANYQADAEGNIIQGSRFNLADGLLETMNGKFKGEIIGGSIRGTKFFGTGSSAVDAYINVYFQTFSAKIYPATIELDDSNDPNAFVSIDATNGITVGEPFTSGNSTFIYYYGIETPSIDCPSINGGTPITSDNISEQSVSYASGAGYASSAGSVSGLHSSSIIPDDTGSGNINFAGSLNAASPTWCDGRYVKISSSDFRLKKNIQSLGNIPDELFMAIKPKQYEFKTDTYSPGIRFGILSQQLENAFKNFGLDPYAYNLIEIADVRQYTDDGMYVSDKIHRINYDNLITWSIYMIQKQQIEIASLKETFKGFEDRIKALENVEV